MFHSHRLMLKILYAVQCDKVFLRFPIQLRLILTFLKIRTDLPYTHIICSCF